MNPSEKIYVAGHRGMVGAAIVRTLKASCGADFGLPWMTEVIPTKGRTKVGAKP